MTLDALSTLPDPTFTDSAADWHDYRPLFGGEVPVDALERLTADFATHLAGPPLEGDAAFKPHFLAVHAWRALAQLAPEAAAVPLTRTLFEVDDAAFDSDWYLEDLPRTIAAIGAPAVPVLLRFMEGDGQSEDAFGSAVEALKLVGLNHPAARDAAVDALAVRLAADPGHSDGVNAFIVTALVELEAVEAAEIIGEAYAARRVDLGLAGDWTMVQMDLGLLPYDPDYRPAGTAGDYLASTSKGHQAKAGAKAKAKKKAKAAKASRKKNRK